MSRAFKSEYLRCSRPTTDLYDRTADGKCYHGTSLNPSIFSSMAIRRRCVAVCVWLLSFHLAAAVSLKERSRSMKPMSRVPLKTSKSAGKTDLSVVENMLAGGLSRATAQAVCHPLNVCKTLLQARGTGTVSTLAGLFQLIARNPQVVFRGIFAQSVMSLPNGAVTFATLELAKAALVRIVPATARDSLTPVLDLVSSMCGTLFASVVSAPQTVILDRTMLGQYPGFFEGARTLWAEEGLRGFYRGWAPAMGSKVLVYLLVLLSRSSQFRFRCVVLQIPSYALTWMFFQQLKKLHARLLKRGATNVENLGIGALASTISVCLMIPMDTVKTRLTTQVRAHSLRSPCSTEMAVSPS